jgi:hypothetical protein
VDVVRRQLVGALFARFLFGFFAKPNRRKTHNGDGRQQ